MPKSASFCDGFPVQVSIYKHVGSLPQKFPTSYQENVNIPETGGTHAGFSQNG